MRRESWTKPLEGLVMNGWLGQEIAVKRTEKGQWERCARSGSVLGCSGRGTVLEAQRLSSEEEIR